VKGACACHPTEERKRSKNKRIKGIDGIGVEGQVKGKGRRKEDNAERRGLVFPPTFKEFPPPTYTLDVD